MFLWKLKWYTPIIFQNISEKKYSFMIPSHNVYDQYSIRFVKTNI